ncbi:MAG: hypothetical protein AAFV92_10165, partial [Pseudomonadota bacterium]
SETKWTGQISFDLIRDANGQIWPLECNPRATSGVHFFSETSGFDQAILPPHSDVTTDISVAQGVRLALWLYGPSALLRSGDLKKLWHAFRHAEDVLNRPDDPVGLLPQIRSVFEFAGVALARGISLKAASTLDIEWDGPNQSSSS